MSQKYPGGIISKTAPVPTGPYENGTAPGIWTLEQQAEFVKQGIWPLAGNVPNYIEDVFSTWLYTGNGSTQTITNGIDLAGEGGLVWAKPRSVVGNNTLYDTSRGISNALISNSTASQQDYSGNGVTSFNSNGFSVTDSGPYAINDTGTTYASWTFRKQPKFFDVVTYTGDGTTGRTVAHNLESRPGFIAIKRTDSTSNWYCAARIDDDTAAVKNETAGDNFGFNQADKADLGAWATVADSTTINLNMGGLASASTTTTNINGATYVAYLWAHNAGGFGLSGNENVISCGSYVGNGGSGNVVNLGYEPQWLLLKGAVGGGSSWYIVDNMRGLVTGGDDNRLQADQADAQFTAQNLVAATATGFELESDGAWNVSGRTYIYIAIRRGPMKVPTDATKVFAPIFATAASGTLRTVGFTADMTLSTIPTFSDQRLMVDRLRGYAASGSATPRTLDTTATAAESTSTTATVYNVWNTTALDGNYANSFSNIWWHFGRAPGFFDEVCYTGTGSARTVAHNLAAVPELMICKARTTGGSGPYNWTVYHTALSAGGFAYLNLTNAGVFSGNTSFWNGTAPTSSVFSLGGSSGLNQSGLTFVNYLFASCPGVSKVGSYTGTGATQVINCGFTAGARFVLIKATSTTGDWYVWDSARGIVAGNDPYLELNNTNAEVTNTDWVDTAATGFELSNAGGNLANSSGVSYIFLAIA